MVSLQGFDDVLNQTNDNTAGKVVNNAQGIDAGSLGFLSGNFKLLVQFAVVVGQTVVGCVGDAYQLACVLASAHAELVFRCVRPSWLVAGAIAWGFSPNRAGRFMVFRHDTTMAMHHIYVA